MPSPNRLSFEHQTPAQRESELWETIKDATEAIESGGAPVLGQPRTAAVPINQGWIQLADVGAKGVIIENDTGKLIEVRRGGSGTVFYEIADGMGQQLDVLENANELFARNGTDNAAVTLRYHVQGEEV